MPFVQVSARSDVGRLRKLNEDSLFAGVHVWAVADGMGGHAAGDVASAIVARHIASLDRADLPLDVIDACVAEANREVVDYAGQHPEAAGLGTTLTGIAEVLIGGVHHWAIFNVGDSRVYRFEEGQLSRATIDHSEVEELIMAGRLTEDEARTHPLRNVITRSIGSVPPPAVDLWVMPQSAGEVFVICSDGLTTEVDDETLRMLLTGTPVAGLADSLVDRALTEGGRDNVTVVAIEVLRPTDDSPDEETNPRPPSQSEGES